ncbi:Oxysterol-binding protein-related protein 2B [Camellia lanceoleosa]|uniref:Oxysterol-binding protein-related protein 2B n=1 Tax=Camellia lanceoleosa TaxID=1840588 RepID=A0ACC0FEU1_9ERIC|nr:Oxysterol-binding protein-related protein 2B [Camellia lanceoleosa]
MKGESPISCGQSGKTVTNPSSFAESMEAFREKLNVMKANVSGVNHEDLTPLFQEEILTLAAALNLLKLRWNMVSNLDESEIVYEDITSQKLSDPKMGMDRGIRGERGGRGVGQRTGFLVNQSEQGEGNDAVNSIPVGNPGNSLSQILDVAAFAVSGYASSEGRHCKPFNPLLGETYEADYLEKVIHFFSEKLLPAIAKEKAGNSRVTVTLEPNFGGHQFSLTLLELQEFDDAEIFQWSKVTTSICNLILGKVYLNHHGIMHIRGNRQDSCKLKFKEQSILDRNLH